jgi:hypothetical protein
LAKKYIYLKKYIIAEMAEMAVLKEKYLIKNELKFFLSTLFFIINFKIKN